MENDVLRAKLESLIRCIKRIESKKTETVEELKNNPDAQDVIILNLERAVQLCVDMGSHLLLDYESSVPQTMAEVFSHLAKNKIIPEHLAENLKKSVGFRNIAVHQYQDIKWEIVMSIIEYNLTDFKQFAGFIQNVFFIHQ